MIMTNVKADRSLAELSLGELTHAVSNCERIVKTSVPLAYSKHTSRFLSVWLFSLPLVLVETLGWRLVPAVAIISWALLSIEEVGNTIEDPFNMPHYISRTAGSLSMPFCDMHPYDDELKLERSFRNIRGDVMDPSPAVSPAFFEAQRGDEDWHELMQEEPSSSWAIPVFQDDDYDVTSFHRNSGWFALVGLPSCRIFSHIVCPRCIDVSCNHHPRC